MTLKGLTKSMQCRVVEDFRQGLTKSMQFIVTCDMRFSTLRDLSKSMHCIVPIKKSSRAFSSGSGLMHQSTGGCSAGSNCKNALYQIQWENVRQCSS